MLPDRLWRLVQERAEAGNVSASEFIRQATAALIFYEMGMRTDKEMARAVRIAREMQKPPPRGGD